MLGDRAGNEKPLDFVIAGIGLVLVLEATRRSIGWTLPILCVIFVLYALFGQSMPDWLFPHRGSSWQQIAQKTFLQSGGVFGIALRVMFMYVFLFVLFGTLLEQTGATGYVIKFARRLFRGSTGGPAKVAVVSSGLMGSLSGSAVANTATTGTFTIPLMKSTGFSAESAGGVEAAASSGGALMPPIMGAGAYMMLEMVEPAVTYVQIIQAALIPAILYYTALLLTVHFHAKRIGAQSEPELDAVDAEGMSAYQGFVFFGSFVILIVMLVSGFTAFRAVSVSLLGILFLSGLSPHTRLVSLPKERPALRWIVAGAFAAFVVLTIMVAFLGEKWRSKRNRICRERSGDVITLQSGDPDIRSDFHPDRRVHVRCFKNQQGPDWCGQRRDGVDRRGVLCRNYSRRRRPDGTGGFASRSDPGIGQ